MFKINVNFNRDFKLYKHILHLSLETSFTSSNIEAYSISNYFVSDVNKPLIIQFKYQKRNYYILDFRFP